jgi:hypothetical protein
MVLHPFIKPLFRASPNITAAATSFLHRIRGGAVVANNAAIDLDLAKIRLEGLSYGTVSALVIAAALSVVGNTDYEELFPIPDKKSSRKRERNMIRFDNILKIGFSICMVVSIACGIYTTVVFTLMDIYGKTALGLGLNDSFVEFFNACGKYRQFGYFSFLGCLITFNVGWLISVLLSYEGKMRLKMAAPACVLSIVGMFHYREIFKLASTLIYAHLK